MAADALTLDAYIRNNLIKAGLMLAGLLVLMGWASLHYERELLLVTRWVFDTIGLSGLIAILFVSDSFASPFPPDAVLIVIAKSNWHAAWWWLVPAIGVLSVVAGHIGFLLGTRLGDARWLSVVLGRFRDKNRALVMRYGGVAVALAAITPIPFSLTCWTAGILRLPYARFHWPCWLRIPRYLVYYVAIAYSENVIRWFTG